MNKYIIKMGITKSDEMRFVPAATRNKWATKKTHGDIQAIHDKTGIPKHQIRDAFKLGYCNESTEEAIDKFLESR